MDDWEAQVSTLRSAESLNRQSKIAHRQSSIPEPQPRTPEPPKRKAPTPAWRIGARCDRRGPEVAGHPPRARAALPHGRPSAPSGSGRSPGSRFRLLPAPSHPRPNAECGVRNAEWISRHPRQQIRRPPGSGSCRFHPAHSCGAAMEWPGGAPSVTMFPLCPRHRRGHPIPFFFSSVRLLCLARLLSYLYSARATPVKPFEFASSHLRPYPTPSPYATHITWRPNRTPASRCPASAVTKASRGRE